MTSSSSLISIVGVTIALLANFISFPLLCLLLVRSRNALSPLFLINACLWVIGLLFCSTYFLYIVINWRGDYSLYSMTLMFWLGTPFFAIMATLSTSVFFLTWDRCLTLLVPYTYTKRRRKLFVIVCVLSNIVVLILMGGWLQFDNRPPLGRVNDCMSYGCVGPTISQKITKMKLFFASTNITSAFVFAWLFLKFNKKQSSSCGTKKVNMLAFFTLFAEIFFNCLPNCGAELFHVTYNVVLSPLIGPYVSYFFSAEALMMSLIYTHSIGFGCGRNKIFNTTHSSQITPVRPLNSNQPPQQLASKLPAVV